MGVSYYSYVVIGCEIDKSKLYTSGKTRGCKCVVDKIEDMTYCSKCGKEVWIDDDLPVEGYDEDNESLFGLKLIYNTDQERYWVAIRSEETSYNSDAEKLDIPDDISHLREKLKAAIGPHGFWDEKKFGIWVVQYCSY